MSKCIFVPKSSISYFILFSLFSILSHFIFLSQFRKLVYQDCKQHVGAGINALMSISDGLGSSIFCRKMEKARPMMEEMDGKVVFFPARVGFSNVDVTLLDSTFPYLYLDLACKQLCFPPGKGINRRNESTRHKFFSGEVLMIVFQCC